MALFQTDQIERYRYCVAACTLFAGGQAFQLRPMNVVGIEITNHYWNDLFPIFKVNFIVDDKTYYTVNKNKSKVKMYIDLQKYVKKESGDNGMRRRYLSGTFCTIDDDADVDRGTDLDIKESVLDIDEMKEFEQSLELYFYTEPMVSGLKNYLTYPIAETCDMKSIILYALAHAGIYNLIMSPPENNTMYKDLHIPPLNIQELVAHYDACYGLYQAGSMIFYGIDNSYILNLKGGATAYEGGEITETCMLVPLETSAQFEATGSVNKRDNKNYIVWNYGKISIATESVSNNAANGSGLFTDKAVDLSRTSSSGSGPMVGTSNQGYLENKGNNPWLSSTIAAQASSLGDVLRGSILDFDASAVKPNKKFTIIFEDPAVNGKHRGTYMLTDVTFKFINDTADGDFQLVAGIELRRMG